MKRPTQLGILLMLLLGAGRFMSAQTNCSTWFNDNSIHTLATSYSAFTPPGINGTYTDQTGCSPKRITNAASQHPANCGVGPIYNNLPVLSADNLYAMGLVKCAGGQEIYRVSDSAVVVPMSNFPGAAQNRVIWAGVNTTGQATDSHTIYYLIDTGTSGCPGSNCNSLLYKGTFLDNGCAPSCTVTSTLLHTFTGYSFFNGFSEIEFSGGATGISDDGDHIAMDSDAGGNSTTKNLISYRFSGSSGNQIALYDYLSTGKTINETQTFHDNTFRVSWNPPNGTTCSPGVDCFTGDEQYDNGLNYLQQFATISNHGSTAWSGSHIYYVLMNNNIGTCAGGNGVLKIDVATLTHTCLVAYGATTIGGSTSCRNGICVAYVQDFRPIGGNVTPNGTEALSVDAATGSPLRTTYHSDAYLLAGSNGMAGEVITMPAPQVPSEGWTNSANNGTFNITASAATGGGHFTVTTDNTAGVLETKNTSWQIQGTNTYPVASNINALWRAYENELVEIDLATGNVYRLVQSRTCPAAQVDYFKEAFSSMSMDGTLVAYGTDFCQNSLFSYTDLMVLPLLTAGGTSLQGVTLRGVSVQ